MIWTILAQLVTVDGANVRSYFSNAPEHFWSPIKHESWVIPAAEVRATQAPTIPLRLGHGLPPAGQIVWLERRASDGSLWCVADCDEDIRPERDRDYYLSVEARYNPGTIGTDIEIDGAALCERSRMIGLQPATLIRPDGLDQHGKATWRLGEFQRSLLEHAKTARYRRRASDPIVVHDERGHDMYLAHEPRPPGPIEYRSAQTVDVSLHDRTIEVRAVPYGEEAIVLHQGRTIVETIANTAFIGVNEQENRSRIKATREHNAGLLFGRVVALDPFRPDGLHAEIKASRTALGDESLELCRDGLLDASIGFGIPKPDGEQWQGQSRRRVVKAWLHEISLVGEPAYQGATVLGVRDRPAVHSTA